MMNDKQGKMIYKLVKEEDRNLMCFNYVRSIEDIYLILCEMDCNEICPMNYKFFLDEIKGTVKSLEVKQFINIVLHVGFNNEIYCYCIDKLYEDSYYDLIIKYDIY